jgi:hypothetical protein
MIPPSVRHELVMAVTQQACNSSAEDEASKPHDCLPGAGMNTFPALLGALRIYALAYRY